MDESTFRMGRSSASGDDDPPLESGTSVGEHLVVGTLAIGGHGRVYVAEHRSTHRRVAIKVLRRDLVDSAEMVSRFLRETTAVSLIRHPGIVSILDTGTLQDGRPYYAMDLLGGRSLAAVIQDRAPLAAGEAAALLGPICEALGAAHAAGVVHRDLKASNVMVLSEADPPVMRLLDFGVAKVHSPGESAYTSVALRLGSAGARAPEQIRAEGVDARTDVYALGVLLYQLLTGRLPFVSGDPDDLLSRYVADLRSDHPQEG
jgi:serine/threonine-protein kinase